MRVTNGRTAHWNQACYSNQRPFRGPRRHSSPTAQMLYRPGHSESGNLRVGLSPPRRRRRRRARRALWPGHVPRAAPPGQVGLDHACHRQARPVVPHPVDTQPRRCPGCPPRRPGSARPDEALHGHAESALICLATRKRLGSRLRFNSETVSNTSKAALEGQLGSRNRSDLEAYSDATWKLDCKQLRGCGM